MIYTLPSNGSFCDILVKFWLEEYQDDLWGLSRITVYLPTNRAVRTLKEAFLRQMSGRTLLLPKMVSFANLDVFNSNISEPVSNLERQLILTKLIQKKQPMGEDKAFSLAQSLANLIDEMHHYNVSFENLENIAPDNFAEHWQETISFLTIIDSIWPKILEERGKIDPSLYQIKQAEALIQNWKERTPTDPVYAVGLTGGLPIVERFLKAVSTLPKGRIYIPDLDQKMSDDVWNALDETHPQYYLKKLLSFLSVKRQDVVTLQEPTDRYHLLSTALIPVLKTHLWQQNINVKTDHTVRLIECKTPQNEAFEIACLLREALQTPAKTAALVTTDRQLARRVKVQMQKWDILLDDSAGTPLSLTPVGTFLIQLARAATTQKQSDLLCVLKHPLCLDGQNYTDFRKKVHQAEKQARSTHKKLNIDLTTDLSPFMNLFTNPIRIPFSAILKAHLQVARNLCTSTDKTGDERLWENQAGQEASDLLTQIVAHAQLLEDIDPLSYADFLKMIFDSVTVRPKYGMHPRLDILGPIEARLQQPDLVIVGSLNEGSFPQTPSCDSWINRPMRSICGLPLPEEKIGVAAQDFMHLLQAKEVVLTRAIKADGVQTIPSRWLIRLQTVLEKSGQKLDTYCEGFSSFILNTPKKSPAVRPVPKPPVSARPNQLSISDICTFLKDPYAIYAKHILKLYKLDDFQETPNEASFGNAVHDTLAAFLKLSSTEQTYEKLIELGDVFFTQEGFNDQNSVFVKTKFEKIASWFIKEYANAFPKAVQHLIEQTAVMSIKLTDKTVYLKGRADRIDVFADNTATIIDYKTGSSIPKASSVKACEEPQLPLEALMLNNGDFQTKPLSTTGLAYWHINGSGNGGEIQDVTPEDMSQLLEYIQHKLYILLEKYNHVETGYPACPKPSNKPSFNDYAHLERLSEWQDAEDA